MSGALERPELFPEDGSIAMSCKESCEEAIGQLIGWGILLALVCLGLDLGMSWLEEHPGVLALVIIALLGEPRFLLLDEPTTHLDLLSVEALIQALKQYEGSLVFISHDVHFIRKLAESTWHISDGQVTRYSGGYDYYLEKSGLLDDEKGGITA